MTMSSREKTASAAAAIPTNSDSEMEWTAEEEIQLFFALEGLKPIGINKHFYMACIVDRLSKSLNRNIPADAIWAHLRTMYNLEILDQVEPLPFPNEQKEFELPDMEFSALLSKKRAESEEKRVISSSEGHSTSAAALGADTMGKDKLAVLTKSGTAQQTKEIDKKVAPKVVEPPKRAAKRTRNSMSLEQSLNSPSTTPPPLQINKRRRI